MAMSSIYMLNFKKIRFQHPPINHCARQVLPSPCPSACPPACFVCLPVCVTPLRTPAWSACLPHPPACWVCVPIVCHAPCLLGCILPSLNAPVHTCSDFSSFVTACAVTLRSPLTALTLTCPPAWYVCSSCVMHLACSAYPALAHCICAAHVL